MGIVIVLIGFTSILRETFRFLAEAIKRNI